jgi:hypothetical protein
MENKRPEFALANHSILAVVSEVHAYFRDMQSYYQIAHGKLLSELENAQDPAMTEGVQQKMDAVNQKLAFFHVLNNSISTVDTVLHTDTMIREFKDQENS